MLSRFALPRFIINATFVLGIARIVKRFSEAGLRGLKGKVTCPSDLLLISRVCRRQLVSCSQARRCLQRQSFANEQGASL